MNHSETKKDDENYVIVRLGNLNLPLGKSIAALIDTPKFKERLASGQIYCEYGTPRQRPHESTKDYMSRYLNIRLDNTCGKISEMWVEDDLVLGKFTFLGPMAPAAQQYLRPTDHIFGVRGLSRDGGLDHIVTFDFLASSAGGENGQ